MQTFQEAGLALGGPDFNPYVMLEVHYNNQNKEQGTKLILTVLNCF